MCGNRAQYSNTRPKLLEVSYGRTLQRNKGLSIMGSPVTLHSALYRVPHKLRTCTPRWSPELRCTSSDRQSTNSGPTTWHYDEDRQRRTHSVDERTGSSLSIDDTPDLTQNLNFLLSCDLHTPKPMKVVVVSATLRPGRWTTRSLPFLNLLSEKRRAMERWQFPQVLPTGLTED